MSKPRIEITDEHVKRGTDEVLRLMIEGRPFDSYATTRRILNAALNPPPQEEIPVSEAMIEAGREGYWSVAHKGGSSDDGYAESYRRMETKRREEEGKAPCGAYEPRFHRRSTDTDTHATGFGVVSTFGLSRMHRRKDDPK